MKNIKAFNDMTRRRFSKGGYIKRKHFDAGGVATNAIAPPVTGPGNPTNTNTTGIGGISSALGLNAQSANIQPGTNAAQLNNAYTGANNAINAQVELTNTLTPGAATGVNAQNTVEQEALNEAAGAGPNPAQAELAQNTGTTVANTAAEIAGARGGSQNVGLMARQAGQAGAGAEQAGAGQAATLEAQQQLAEQGQAANIAGTQVGQAQGATTALNTAQQNEQNTLENANTSANNAAVGMQENINNVNAQNNQGILGGITSGLSSLTGGLLNKGGAVEEKVNPHGKHKLEFIHKMTKLGMEHYDGGGTVAPNPNNPSSMGVPSGVLSALNINHADGGPITANPLTAGIVNPPGSPAVQPQYNQSTASSGPGAGASPSGKPTSLADAASNGYASGQKWAQNHPTVGATNAVSDASGVEGGAQWTGSDNSDPNMQNVAKGGEIFKLHPSQQHQVSANHFAQYFAKGGESEAVPAKVSPGERYWNPEEVEQIKHGADPMKLGKVFPGKDKVPGKDSYKNDTLPVTLEVGGVVNPLHIEKTKNADKARLFVLKSLKATGKHMAKPKSMK